MKNESDELSLLLLSEEAANEEFLRVLPVASTQAWSPYEVWCTRIKPVQNQRGLSARSLNVVPILRPPILGQPCSQAGRFMSARLSREAGSFILRTLLLFASTMQTAKKK
jgi:hypothetical protein